MKASTSAVNLPVMPAVVLMIASMLPSTIAYATDLVEEVIVTATKREESSQDVPISITTYTGDSIDVLGIDVSIDIARQVPNMQMKSEFTFTTPTIFIRGFGFESFFANSIAPVGLYTDGVYIGQNIVQGFQLFDLERVEILRGPQGTLFGRNTTAGLVNFITRKPNVGEDTNGRLELGAGDYGQFSANGAVGFPLGDTAAVRLSGFWRTSDGFFDNVNPALDNDDEGALDAYSLRGVLRWQPTEDLDIVVNVHGGESDSQIRGFKPSYTNCPPGVRVGTFQGGCTGPFGLGLSDTPGFHDTTLSLETVEDVETVGTSVQIDWDIGDYTVTSLTGFDTAEMTRFEDDDGNVLTILGDTFLADTDFWSQELRLTSNYKGPFNWLIGFNYYGDTLDSLLHFNDRDVPFPPITGTGLAQELTQKTDSWAVFGELNYRFAEAWKLTLGLRLTQDEREADIKTYATNTGQIPAPFFPVVPATEPASYDLVRAASFEPFIGPFIPPTNIKSDWFEWTGRAVVSYDIDDRNMIFVSASRGFKGGEFNGGALTDPREAVITDPEFLDSYEIGYKGTLLNDTLQFNATAYYMEIRDQQLQINNVTGGTVVPILANAGSSDSKGVEFEFRWQPDEHWFFSGGGAYLDAKFKQFVDPATGIDRSGNALEEAPEWSFNGIVRYEHPVGNGILTLQSDFVWNDDRFWTVENDPVLKEEAYALVNGRVAYAFDAFNKGRFELALVVKNIFDNDYLLSGFDAVAIADNYIFIPGDPRTIGGQLIYRFE